MDCYFHGYSSRDRIARKVHKGSGTVSREIEKFENEVNSRGLLQAAEVYGVSQIVSELHELSIELKKNNLTATEAKQGVAVAAKLKLLQVEPDEIEPFIANVYSRSTAKGYSPSDIVDHCESLKNLEDTYHGTFEEIKNRFEGMGSKIDSLSEDVKRLNLEKNQAEKSSAELWEQYDIDKKGLEKFNETKHALKQLGLNIDELDKAKTTLLEIRKQKHNSRHIIKKITEIKDLDSRKEVLDEEVKQAAEALKDIKDEIAKATTHIKANRKTLDEAQKIEETGLTIKDIQAIRNTVVRIGANHALTSKQAIENLQNDITVNYDKILGLEPQLISLNSSKEKLQKEITDMEKDVIKTKQVTKTQIASLEQEYKAVKEKIDAYLQVRRKGVIDEDLLRWANIIATTKLNPAIIDEELKTQKNLKQLEDEAKERIKILKHLETQIKTTVENLAADKIKIEKSIESVKQAGINQIKQAADITTNQATDAINIIIQKMKTATEISSNQAKDTLDTMTLKMKTLSDQTTKQSTNTLNTTTNTVNEISQKTQNFLDESKQKIQQILDNTEKSTTTTEQNLTHISDQVNAIIKEAMDAGEEIGRLKPIHEAIRFIDTGQGEPKVVIPLTFKFLTNLKTWVGESKGRGSMTLTINTLINSLNVDFT